MKKSKIVQVKHSQRWCTNPALVIETEEAILFKKKKEKKCVNDDEYDVLM